MALQVLEVRKETFGTEHPSTLSAMNNWAHTWWVLDRLVDGFTMVRTYVQKGRDFFGPEHSYMVTAVHDYNDVKEHSRQMFEMMQSRGMEGNLRDVGVDGDLREISELSKDNATVS